jgi:NAD(P)-dependent dehydrogenase (short-subunit alcohol dehydrogenase family)
MVQQTLRSWGRVDILVNNAGILRDKTFARMSLDEFRLVIEVNLMGAVHCTKAVWEAMRQQQYGRIVNITSSVGLWGNFGQSNYGAAKMALVGLMQSLALEGAKYGIHVNCIAPTATTQMTNELLPAERRPLLKPEFVGPAVLALASESAPTQMILCAGGGSFEMASITVTNGIHIAGDPPSVEELVSRWGEVADREGEQVLQDAYALGDHQLQKAGHALQKRRGK